MLVGSSILGCGGQAWPRVNGIADPTFLEHQRGVETIDVLPVDLQVWTVPGNPVDPFVLARALDPQLGGLVVAQLARRGYQVVAQIDREGRYVSGDGQVRQAMARDDVAQTEYVLSGYGHAQSEVKGALLVPYLPARLGAATGSHATLYIGGWAFAGADRRPSKAGKVIKVVLIVAVVAIVAVAIIAGLKGDKGGGAAGKVAEGAGRVATGAVKVAGRVAIGTARAAGHVSRAMLRDPNLFYAVTDMVDAFARAGTHAEVYAGRPDYYSMGPRKGRSAMLLEMTLIDNRTGRTLWHARQRFPASPTRPAEVERAVQRLMAALPAQ
jgi:hypothetical protein